jgi:hypothetical protein
VEGEWRTNGASNAAKVRTSALARAFGYLWPPAMTVLEASVTGTLRTILVLVALWWLLRMLLRYQQQRRTPPVHHTNGPQRPKGEVRIERPTETSNRSGRPGTTIIDADFEEIK